MFLNIGCGLKPQKHYVNLDLDKNAKIDILSDVFILPFRDNAFNHIEMWETLEHLANPLRALREISRVLKTDSEFVFSIPNIYHIEGILRFIKRVTWRSTAPEHLNAWRLPELQNLISNTDFKFIKYIFFNTHWHNIKRRYAMLPKHLKCHSVSIILQNKKV